MAKRGHETVAHVACFGSGCAISGGLCLLKAHVKNGVVTSLENSDVMNQGMPREDIPEDSIRAEMIQRRPCSRGYAWTKTVSHPDRAKYPLKRVGEKGNGGFERISWNEALDIVAAKIHQMQDKYGQYCILGDLPLLQWVGPLGFTTWGRSSFSGYILPDLVTLGFAHSNVVEDKAIRTQEYTDIFDSKLILWFGTNPPVTDMGLDYWVMLAKERGIPIIIVDPQYSIAAEVLADQWIPIRPGTDLAMLLAMANVLLKENLYDKDYVAKFVEPTGFLRWQDYVLGRAAGSDGKIDRSPEWAESICGVPAQTIRELTRLYARSKPCNFRLHRAATRQLYGENSGRASIYLQAMTGNLGKAGGSAGCEPSLPGPRMMFPIPRVDWKSVPPTYPAQKLLSKRLWMDAILLRDKLDKGEMSEDEYRRTCGIAQDWPLVNIHMAWLQSQVTYKNPSFKADVRSGHRSDTVTAFGGDTRSGRVSLGNQDLNKTYRALRKLDFVASAVFFMSNYSVRVADIVLPLADTFFEEARGFVASGSASNYFVCGFKAVEPPGEARPLEWILVQLAKRLGVAEQYSPRLVDVVDDYPRGWDRRNEDLLKEAYETWAERPEIAPRNPPSWAEFRPKPIYRVPFEGKPQVAFEESIERGEPFDTPSGKVEFYSNFLADPEMARKSYVLPRRKIDNRVCFGGSVPPVIPPMAMWMLPPNSMLAEKAETHPLTMLTSHSMHRQHTSQDNNPWLRDESRHSLHISPADAETRGISDGDLVRVYNGNGEVLISAYVTSRMTPGVVVVPHGAWPELGTKKTDLMPEGIDQRGADNFLTSSNYYPWPVGALRCADLVQVEKHKG
ncbi:MAG: molybdopterin-dependent oxidoreductase [Chloroflexi bacterium]|nr:molybdopterin-dependent oxidoreductase [Chloroflexota bacterium]